MSELTQSLAPTKLRPWHEAVIDMWIVNPELTQREIAAALGKTEGWLSIIVNSDAFKAARAARQAEILDPAVSVTVEERFKAVAAQGAELMLDRIVNRTVDNADLASFMRVANRAIGLDSPGPAGPALQQNLYVIPTPADRPKTADEWKQRVAEVIDVEAKRIAG